MAIYKSDIVDINLETCNIHRAFLNRTIGSGDSGADHFGIRVFRDGAPVDLTGVSVQGIFLPPQGSPIAITDGNSVSGNEAYVVLPQACYNYDGQFCLSIKLVGGGVTGTMRIVDGMVDNTHSTGTVAPTETVPTYQEILSLYDDMVAATAAANGAIAKPYAQLTFPVKKGDYTIVDGALKRALVDIATSETYTAAHWTDAKLGPDVSALKSAFDINNYLTNNGIFEITQANLVSGVWGYTTPSANAKRLRTNMLIPVKQGTVVEYSTETDQMIYLGEAETETSGSTGFITTGWVSGEGSWVIPKDGFLTFNVKTNPEANISVSDYDSTVVIKTYNRREMNRMLKQVGIDSTSAASVYNNDAKNLQPNTFSWIFMSYFNDLPSDVSSDETGWIISLSTASREDSITVETQFLVVPTPSSNNYSMYYRRIQNGTMSAWKKTTNTRILVSSDLNDLKGDCCVLLTSSNTYTHAPFALGTIYNIPFSSTLSVQYGFQFGTGAIWYRRKSTTWGDWINLVPNMDKYRTGGKYVAFGDSLTYGAVWSPTSGTALHRVKEEWRIPTRIALAIDMINSFANEAIGGIGYFKEQDGQTLISQIADYDFTGVELVTVMAGANDHFYTDLGTAADADTANTICGGIKNIIHTISAANPKTQIIVIQPLPCGIDGTQYDVWSSKQGDGYVFRWSLNEFDEQVSQLCHDEHVGYLNWWDSVMCRNWQYAGYNGSTGPNFTHPTADADYYLFGNFIAGKVSALYHGLN